MGRNTIEGKKGSLSVTVHLSLSSGTKYLVSTIDICSQGYHLQRGTVPIGKLYMAGESHHYQGHSEAHVGAYT
jgi:hypothetical protein